jgi:hypothetical protein
MESAKLVLADIEPRVQGCRQAVAKLGYAETPEFLQALGARATPAKRLVVLEAYVQWAAACVLDDLRAGKMRLEDMPPEAKKIRTTCDYVTAAVTRVVTMRRKKGEA